MGCHYRTRRYGGESGTDHRLWDRRLWDLRRLASVERCRRRHRRRVSGWRRTSQYGVCSGHDLDRRRNGTPDVDEQDHNARLTRYHRASHPVSGSRSDICTAGGTSLNRSHEETLSITDESCPAAHPNEGAGELQQTHEIDRFLLVADEEATTF